MTPSYSLMLTFLIAMVGTSFAQQQAVVKLPPVAFTSDKPLFQAMQERKTTREFRPDSLSAQDVSNLLWSAIGVNRHETGHRTVPSALNKQSIEVYIVDKNGISLYDPLEHRLLGVRTGDHRAATGSQEFVGKAPLTILYVSDYRKMDFTGDDSRKLWMASVEAGHSSQNVYLYGAAAGLGVVVRASIDREALGTLLRLPEGKHVILAQTVGHPVHD